MSWFQPADAWLTARDIALLTGRPIGTIYRLAHDDHWTRVKTRPVWYLVADVLDTLRRLDKATED